jgi:ribosome-associated protein
MDDLPIKPGLTIPAACLAMTFSRSSGPGGQNVNKLNTRVSVSLDIAGCDALTDTQKQRLLKVLHTRLDKAGVLTITSQEHRSQHANRQEALDRMAELVAKALKPPRVRKKTKPSKGAVERRLQSKKERGQIKQSRSQKFE